MFFDGTARIVRRSCTSTEPSTTSYTNSDYSDWIEVTCWDAPGVSWSYTEPVDYDEYVEQLLAQIEHQERIKRLGREAMKPMDPPGGIVTTLPKQRPDHHRIRM